MRVLILGASGLVGGNLLRYLDFNRSWNVIGTYFSYKAKNCLFFNTLDLNDVNNFDYKTFNPEVVVHCGALTWVDYCEENEEESHEKTVVSTESSLKIAKECNSTFVYISTDYVFDGTDGPYYEDHATNPVSIYGRHKLQAEKLVENSGLNHLIARVTNVYGNEERNKNFVSRLIEKAVSGENEEMNLPYDQYATPVNAQDIAKALTLLIESNKTGVYNLASTDLVNRCQLATMVLKYIPDHKIKVKPVLTSDLNQKAERPLNGGLLSAKFIKEFPDFEFSNVQDYLTNYLSDNQQVL